MRPIRRTSMIQLFGDPLLAAYSWSGHFLYDFISVEEFWPTLFNNIARSFRHLLMPSSLNVQPQHLDQTEVWTFLNRWFFYFSPIPMSFFSPSFDQAGAGPKLSLNNTLASKSSWEEAWDCPNNSFFLVYVFVNVTMKKAVGCRLPFDEMVFIMLSHTNIDLKEGV